jgi:hypothetical protein
MAGCDAPPAISTLAERAGCCLDRNQFKHQEPLRQIPLMTTPAIAGACAGIADIDAVGKTRKYSRIAMRLNASGRHCARIKRRYAKA